MADQPNPPEAAFSTASLLENYGFLLKAKSTLEQSIKNKIHQVFQMTQQTLRDMLSEPQKLDQLQYTKERASKIVSTLENWDYAARFPGAQPISFQDDHCDIIQMVDHLVCEKTDGVRFFLLEAELLLSGNQQARVHFLIDRNYAIRQVFALNTKQYLSAIRYHFENLKNLEAGNLPLSLIALFDGELSLDFDMSQPPNEGGHRPFEAISRFLAFDCLVANKKNVMHLNYKERVKAGESYVRTEYLPHRLLLEEKLKDPAFAEKQNGVTMSNPFIIVHMKDVFEVQQVPGLLKVIDKGLLPHENDGIIFTQNTCPYYPGTCDEIIKWKPPHMNSIDFQFKMIKHKFFTIETSDEDNSSRKISLTLWGLFTKNRDTIQLFDFFVFDPFNPQQAQLEKDFLKMNEEERPIIMECNQVDVGDNQTYASSALQFLNEKLNVYQDMMEEQGNSTKLVFCPWNYVHQCLQDIQTDAPLINYHSDMAHLPPLRKIWNIMRPRYDKTEPNAHRTALKVDISIKNPVLQQDIEIVCATANPIAAAPQLGKRPAEKGLNQDDSDDFGLL